MRLLLVYELEYVAVNKIFFFTKVSICLSFCDVKLEIVRPSNAGKQTWGTALVRLYLKRTKLEYIAYWKRAQCNLYDVYTPFYNYKLQEPVQMC